MAHPHRPSWWSGVALSEARRDDLSHLGWMLEGEAEEDYHSELSVAAGLDALLEMLVATLKVYGLDPTQLRLEFLSGKVRDVATAGNPEPIEPLDAKAVLATFDMSLSRGESIRAATRGLEEACGIATNRRVFMVKRFLLGSKPNEWDYSDLTVCPWS